jgi:hypothetical protein
MVAGESSRSPSPRRSVKGVPQVTYELEFPPQLAGERYALVAVGRPGPRRHEDRGSVATIACIALSHIPKDCLVLGLRDGSHLLPLPLPRPRLFGLGCMPGGIRRALGASYVPQGRRPPTGWPPFRTLSPAVPTRPAGSRPSRGWR